jgi:type III secretory pathway component EscS
MLAGWPQPYRGYTLRDPFVVKNFSERIRLYLENSKEREHLFPITKKIKSAVRDVLDTAVFHGASVAKSATGGQKEVQLNIAGDALHAVSYMAWSSGQREFLPLLLGCYELLPGGRITKQKEIEWVILEEPEMGLHPMGIFAVVVLILDLLSRDYKVVVATHSSYIVDIVWAISVIKDQTLPLGEKIELIAKLLDLPYQNPGISAMIKKILTLRIATYCFHYNNEGKVYSMDISSLNPGDSNEVVAGWGGLASYNMRVSDIVAEAVRDAANG